MANYTIDSMTYGSNTYTFTIPYGTCSVDADVRGKAVGCANFTKLETGARVAVKFTKGNTNTTPVLNVNNTGAKSIVHPSDSRYITEAWCVGSIIDFVYDGTNWVIVGNMPNDIYTHNIINDGQTTTFGLQAQEGSIDDLYSAYAIHCDGTISSDDSISAYDFYENEVALSEKYAAKNHTHTLNYSYDKSTQVLTISN